MGFERERWSGESKWSIWEREGCLGLRDDVAKEQRGFTEVLKGFVEEGLSEVWEEDLEWGVQGRSWRISS